LPNNSFIIVDENNNNVLIPLKKFDNPRTSFSRIMKLRDENTQKNAFPIEDLETRLQRGKEYIKDLPRNIEIEKNSLEDLRRKENFSKSDFEELNQSIKRNVEFSESNPKETLRKCIENQNKRYNKFMFDLNFLQKEIPLIENRLESEKNKLFESKSYFVVSTSFINSGKNNTAVKYPALLRVFIGDGNYIDIKLKMNDFENKSDIPQSGTRNVSFNSEEISSFPKEDIQMIKNYWGQAIKTSIFLEDIYGNIFESNKIPFAEGLYQKIIYDRLSLAAGNSQN